MRKYHLFTIKLLLCADDPSGHDVEICLDDEGMVLKFLWFESVRLDGLWTTLLIACLTEAEKTREMDNYVRAEHAFICGLRRRFPVFELRTSAKMD